MCCTTAGVAGIAMEVPRVFGSSGVSVVTGALKPATLLGDIGLTRTVVPATDLLVAGREFLRARSHGIRDVVVLEGAS